MTAAPEQGVCISIVLASRVESFRFQPKGTADDEYLF